MIIGIAYPVALMADGAENQPEKIAYGLEVQT